MVGYTNTWADSYEDLDVLNQRIQFNDSTGVVVVSVESFLPFAYLRLIF
jgi:hypothetical protein